ncbi:MAG TPA: VCBS repeat-containing protein, partial [Xanthobacteraceae bacterium]
YWVTPNVPPATSVPPQWYVNGVAYTSDYTVQPGDDVQLLVGNNINDPAQIRVQVTPLGTGTSAEFVTYDIWSVDPNVAALVQAAGAQAGAPTPSDVIASAQSWNTVFGNLPNTNLCNWIADNVAAAAGATMPFPNALLDPSLNVSGGFWRAVYTSAGPAPQQDWYPLVQPGDIVRMQWFKPESPQDISGHTTTVLGAVNPDGTISVYDNIDHVNGVETIGIHDATYWPLTGPASITIYRLDPDQQYLTQGTSLAEVIQGSVYNNLIQPGGGADIISGGPGHNEIQDTTAHLNGITVTDFKFGDAFDFTDLNPAQATVAFAGTTLQVFMGGAAVATISLPTLPATGTFVLTPDGSGGSLVELDPSAAPWTFLAAGDFNGDGVTDLIWQDPTTGASIEWLMSRNGGVGSMPATPPVQGWTLVATGDFNHDGITDLMWQNSATGATSEWLMSASGGLGSNPATPPVAGWSLITSGDFNGDGITDLMWQNATTGATSEWLMSANGLASNPATPPVSGWYLVATGDFNHDGITDMMWKNAATGDTSEWLMSADGGLAGNPGTPGGQGWSVVATGDFNGDGVQDLMWQNVLTGATSEWLMSASGGLANNPPTPGAPGWKVAAIGDLAGGSIDELMWQNGASGATSEWLMSANGGLGTNPSTPGAQGWNLAATGDFNGDGITDLMWQNATTGATSEWLMSPSGGLAGNPPTPSALGWKLVTSGDFNGDGIADLMWQNTATGATSEWLMSASGGLASNPATPTAAGIPTPMTSSAAVMTSATATEANGLSPNDAGSDLDPVRAGHSLALATVTHPAHAIADLPLV